MNRRWGAGWSWIMAAGAFTTAAGAESPTPSDGHGPGGGAMELTGGVLIVPIDGMDLSGASTGSSFSVERFPLDGRSTADLVLTPFRVTGPESRFVVGRRHGDDVSAGYDPARVMLLSGHVAGEPQSDVFIAVTETRVTGHIDTGPGGRRYALSSHLGGGDRLPPGRVAVFPASGGSIELPPVPRCGTQTAPFQDPPAHGPAEGGGSTRKQKLIEVAVDTDYEFFELFGNLDEAYDYVLALYGEISHVYARDVNARVIVTFIRLWDDPDDLYNEPDPFAPFRSHWGTFMGGVERDVAQLLTGRRDLPYGGVAMLNGLCTAHAYSVAGYLLGSFPDPARPSAAHWDITVTAHELGHNCNTVHTHDYVPPIDECAFGQDTRGTIMSYCHVRPGGNANVDLRFHKRVREVMQEYIDAAVCVVTDCNGNGTDDPVDIASGTSSDVNGNQTPDECEDCNDNGVLDPSDIIAGSPDVDGDGVPDECQPDCNLNGRPDAADVMLGFSLDRNGDLIPDECEPDCDGNDRSDYTDIVNDMGLDIDRNVVLDSCQDCDSDGIDDFETMKGANNLWVAGNTRIAEFHGATGVLVRATPIGSVNQPRDVLIDETGRILVTSATGSVGSIVEFDRAGNLVGDFVPPVNGALGIPEGITFGPNGNLLVVDLTNHRVLEYDGATGSFVRVFIPSGSGGLIFPGDIVVGPDENVYVANKITHRVTVYDGLTGASLGDFFAPGTTLPNEVGGLAFKPDGHLLVSSTTNREVLEYDGATGEFLRVFTRGPADGTTWTLIEPRRLRVGPDGNVYVADFDGGLLIHKYDGDTGLFLRSYYVLPQGGVNDGRAFDFMPDLDGVDCNLNYLPDRCDIADGTSRDINHNDRPDECESIGDDDGDGDVDLDDYIGLAGCLSGPGGGVPPGCGVADIDADDDVDLIDLGWFATRFTGNCAFAITQQPTGQLVCLGESVTFEVQADSEQVAYQWYHDGQKVPGATDPVLTIDPVTGASVGAYSAAVSTSCRTIQSGAAQLALHDPPLITTQPQSVATCLDDSVDLSVAAEGFPPLSYQWRFNNVNIPGATDSTYSISPVTEGDLGFYRCQVNDGCGSWTLSASALVSSTNPVIVTHPTGATLCTGQSHFLFVSAPGATAFQWYKDGEPLPGANSPFYSIPSAQPEDSGVYHVVASNSCSDVASDPAIVTVNDCP